jgi:hypothetical protein
MSPENSAKRYGETCLLSEGETCLLSDGTTTVLFGGTTTLTSVGLVEPPPLLELHALIANRASMNTNGTIFLVVIGYPLLQLDKINSYAMRINTTANMERSIRTYHRLSLNLPLAPLAQP